MAFFRKALWLVPVLAFFWLPVQSVAAPSRELRSVPAAGRKVAFAINVVWGDPYVLPMATELKRSGSRATFFLGGNWAAKHPAESRELRAMGMEIGNHGQSHRHVGSLGVAANREEIATAREAIKAASGVTPHLYAPAYGELSPAVFQAAAAERSTVVMWAIDTIDWRKSHSASIIKQRVLSRLSPGAIVLMHPTERTQAALAPLLTELKARGYDVVSVSDLLKAAGAGTPATHAAPS